MVRTERYWIRGPINMRTLAALQAPGGSPSYLVGSFTLPPGGFFLGLNTLHSWPHGNSKNHLVLTTVYQLAPKHTLPRSPVGVKNTYRRTKQNKKSIASARIRVIGFYGFSLMIFTWLS